jgi:hypothetical protein
MERAGQYLSRAEQAERLAKTMINERDRAALREIAEEWRKLARQAEALAKLEQRQD